MDTQEVPCQIRVNINHATKTLSLVDCPSVPAPIKQQWCSQLIALQERPPSSETIRPWNILLNKDGTIESLPSSPLSHEGEGRQYVYPSHFRIPPSTIADLPLKEQIQRAELFAIGSMLYTIRSSKLPFSHPDNDNKDNEEEIQAHFLNADIPQDLTTLPLWPMILCCWSIEFFKEFQKLTSSKKGNRFIQHVQAHPYLTAIQASGLLISATALAAPALLGAAGFSALGPVAGSAATAWQSSQGLVQAGSLFSWLQSAAMGGAAAGTITTAGILGGGSTVGATAFGLVADGRLPEKETKEFLERYREVFRRGPTVEEKDGVEEKDSVAML